MTPIGEAYRQAVDIIRLLSVFRAHATVDRHVQANQATRSRLDCDGVRRCVVDLRKAVEAGRDSVLAIFPAKEDGLSSRHEYALRTAQSLLNTIGAAETAEDILRSASSWRAEFNTVEALQDLAREHAFARLSGHDCGD